MFVFRQVYTNAIFKSMTFLFLITLLISPHCQCMQLSFMQGQKAILNFPYPCNTTEVTLQYAYRQPFYRSTDESLSLLPHDQVGRFRVQNRVNTDGCFLSLTISNVMRNDEGTYILSALKDGQLLVDDTQRIWLQVDYPPGKPTCVQREDNDGDLVSLECTASVGSISGKIECYQNGQWMPPLTGPMESYKTLKQSILITKSQPVFCCSSTQNENKTVCECNDTALNLPDDSSNDPCPTTSTITSKLAGTTRSQVANSTIYHSPTTAFNISNTETECKFSFVPLMIISILFILAILVIVSIIVYYKKKQQKRPKYKHTGCDSNTQETCNFMKIKNMVNAKTSPKRLQLHSVERLAQNVLEIL